MIIHVTDGFAPFPGSGFPIEQTVMPLLTIADGEVASIGTGFIIAADGLMITAVHVIEEGMKRMVQKTNDDGSTENLLGFYAMYVTDQKHGTNDEHCLGGLLPIHKVSYSKGLDIGYCWLKRPVIEGKPLTFPVLRLSPGLPKVGENVLGMGHYQMRGDILSQTQENGTVLKYDERTALTTGQITEIYPERRDNGMLTFPCFCTNARFEHGMSGGPILNEHGSVCGVICSCLPPGDDSPGYTSYGSLLWLALGTSIEVIPCEGAQPEMMSIYDLIQRGYTN
jgi:Trypsin-like peptidase domain